VVSGFEAVVKADDAGGGADCPGVIVHAAAIKNVRIEYFILVRTRPGSTKKHRA